MSSLCQENVITQTNGNRKETIMHMHKTNKFLFDHNTFKKIWKEATLAGIKAMNAVEDPGHSTQHPRCDLNSLIFNGTKDEDQPTFTDKIIAELRELNLGRPRYMYKESQKLTFNTCNPEGYNDGSFYHKKLRKAYMDAFGGVIKSYGIDCDIELFNSRV